MKSLVRRARRGLLLPVLVAVTVIATATAAAPRAPHVRVSVGTTPFKLALSDGHGHTTFVGGLGGDTFAYSDTTGNEHHVTGLRSTSRNGAVTTYHLGTDDPARTATVTVQREAPNRIRVSFAVARPATVTAIRIPLIAPTAAHYLGTGERTDAVDMRGLAEPLKAWSDCHGPSPAPFFASTAGFGAWATTTAVGRIAFPGANDNANTGCSIGAPQCSVGPIWQALRMCFKTAAVTLTFDFGSIASIVSDHARATGLPRAPWLPQLGLIKWRDRVAGPADLYDDITELRTRNIPIEWVLLDNPWETGAASSGCYGALQFDPSAYPDPKAMIQRIHAEGVLFMLWISPQIRRPDCPAPPTYPDGWLTGNEDIFEWDLTLPAARRAYTSQLERLVRLGVDGFKGDRASEVNLEPDILHGGPGALTHNLIPLLYARSAAAALASVHGRDFATLFQTFVPGSSSFLPGLVGPDATQDYPGLSAEIRAAQTAGIAEAPVWGSDVGGYIGGAPLTASVFVRWAQFSALTPIFEVGGNGANATFWTLGDYAVDGLRSAATLHYELVPYLYSLAGSAARTGIPVVRALGLTWPDDGQAWKHDGEFSVGDALLANPVTSDSNRSATYLPRGAWVDFFTGADVQGGRTVPRRNGPYDFPLYLRRGSAIPYAFRTPRVWAADWRTNDLLRPSRQGWAVAPGATPAQSVADRGATVSVGPVPGGDRITIAHALREQQLLVYPRRRTCGVQLDGRAIPHVAEGALVAKTAAWATVKGNRVVVKSTGAGPTVEVLLRSCG